MQCYHTPVMLKELLRWLNLKRDSKVLDVTLGGASHALAVLQVIIPGGLLIGIDRDDDALREARSKLSRFGSCVRIFKARMGEISRVISEAGIDEADAIIADLGVSSFQLNEEERGFSFMKDGPLDMRMDQSAGVTARDLIENAAEKGLADIIWEYGEERYARQIARAIAGKCFKTTGELAQAILEAGPSRARHGRIHPATRTFQALRIAVNDEMGELERFLEDAPGFLSIGGRMAVISYHSLEDRQVKRAFRGLAMEGGYFLPVKKPIYPSEEEVRANPRARSAKMRVLEKKGNA